jgi:hypothetical protein
MDKPPKGEPESKKRQPYSQPAMVEYGQVLALTQGQG